MGARIWLAALLSMPNGRYIFAIALGLVASVLTRENERQKIGNYASGWETAKVRYIIIPSVLYISTTLLIQHGVYTELHKISDLDIR